MNEQEKQEAARTAVESLMRADRAKALALAVLLASTSMAGCAAPIQNPACPGQPQEAPCIQPSGAESGWLTQPRWPAQETGPNGSIGYHLATDQEFTANPRYTQLRAGETGEAGPRYYGGGHYWRSYHIYGDGGSSGGGGISS